LNLCQGARRHLFKLDRYILLILSPVPSLINFHVIFSLSIETLESALKA